MNCAMIVHGGLKAIAPEEAGAYQSGCLAALEAGWALLLQQGSAIEAAEAAVRVLEDDPLFNAGFGSVLNAHGKVELDAAIMDGFTLRAGAVAAIRGVCHPVSVARRLMESGKAVLLAGDGAHRFAVQQAQELCPMDSLVTEAQRKEWEGTKTDPQAAIKDTVGCVALDSRGHLASATSTGGLMGKLPGRVGDSPLIGCGLYADNLGGASLTGDGESITRTALASRILAHLHTGLSPQEAADVAIRFFARCVPGEAGCIVLDRKGRAGFAHHSPNLAGAYINSAMARPFAFTRKESARA